MQQIDDFYQSKKHDKEFAGYLQARRFVWNTLPPERRTAICKQFAELDALCEKYKGRVDLVSYRQAKLSVGPFGDTVSPSKAYHSLPGVIAYFKDRKPGGEMYHEPPMP